MSKRKVAKIWKAMSVWLFFSVTLASLMLSCIPDPLDVESVPTVTPELVVSTQIIPDQSLLVLLTRTFGALDASDDSDPAALLELIAVNDALVTVEGPNGTDTLPSLGNGTYGGVFIPFKADETYHLSV